MVRVEWPFLHRLSSRNGICGAVTHDKIAAAGHAHGSVAASYGATHSPTLNEQQLTAAGAEPDRC